jgi:hypothetical protein
MTILDHIVVYFTTLFIFLQVKQLLSGGSVYLINSLLGVWVSLTIFDMYARWRTK